MLRLTKTKLVAMLLIASTLVMFNSIKVSADAGTPLSVAGVTVYIGSYAYSSTANAYTNAADPNSGIICGISHSKYVSADPYSGKSDIQEIFNRESPNSVSVSFSCPIGYQTLSIETDHYAYYGSAYSSDYTSDLYP